MDCGVAFTAGLPTSMQATKYVGSHSQLAVFPKKEIFQFGSPVLGLSVSGKIM